jgi:hypothetical protein
MAVITPENVGQLQPLAVIYDLNETFSVWWLYNGQRRVHIKLEVSLLPYLVEITRKSNLVYLVENLLGKKKDVGYY